MKKYNILLLLLVSITILTTSTCRKFEIKEITKLQTGNVSNIGLDHVNVTSYLIDVGPGASEYGHCWSTSQNPVCSDFKKGNSKPVKGEFTSEITDLEVNTMYYVRPYVIDNGNTIYGEQTSFTTLLMPLSITTPASGTSWSMASKQTIIWAEDVTGNIKIELFKNDQFISELFSGVSSDDKQVDWFIPVQLEASLDYSLKITSESDDKVFASSAQFTLEAQETSTVSDYDGNTYTTIKIGDQWWMAENLKSTHYADGTALVDGTGVGNFAGDYITKYFFYYNDNPSIGENYGKLYTWSAAMNQSIKEGVQGICPNGWHVPTESEWQTLFNMMGGDDNAGGKLKETGFDYWESPNTGATNASGFSALPGGRRSYNGVFEHFNNACLFYTSSSQYSETYAAEFPTIIEIWNNNDTIRRWTGGGRSWMFYKMH